MSLMRICVIDSFYWYIGRQRIDDMQTFDRKSFFCQENSSFIIYYHNAKKHKYKRITEAYIRLQFSTGIFIIIYCSELKSQKNRSNKYSTTKHSPRYVF